MGRASGPCERVPTIHRRDLRSGMSGGLDDRRRPTKVLVAARVGSLDDAQAPESRSLVAHANTLPCSGGSAVKFT